MFLEKEANCKDFGHFPINFRFIIIPAKTQRFRRRRGENG